MGSSKKKEKKRKHDDEYSDSDSGENYPAQSGSENVQKRSSNSQASFDRRGSSSKLSKGSAKTEEYISDYPSEEIKKRAKEMSMSPDRETSPHGEMSVKRPGEKLRSSYDEHTARKTDKFSSRKRDITPPPPPPGMDWPFEAPKTQQRSRSPRVEDSKRNRSNDLKDWKEMDDRNRDRDYQDNVQRKLKSKLKEEKDVSPTRQSSGDSSLSIEETNKIRAKLGLKPLQHDAAEASSDTVEKSYEDRGDVHAPPKNISEEKSNEKLRERMEAIREKRKINKKLLKTKGLGEDNDPVIESAAEWVARNRKQEHEKKIAERRERVLAEMDQEFGISDLVEGTLGREIKKEKEYTSKELADLKVQHKISEFQEGAHSILTLDDKFILDEDNSDVLVNVNIIDEERARKNIQNRSKKSGYQAYDDVDEETGMFKVRNLLDKYDEVIEGETKNFFRLDGSGKADIDDELEMERIRNRLKEQQVSLDMPAAQLAKDYYTEEELVKFKKPRKKIRKVVRKRDVLKADDLLKLSVDDTRADRGSRNVRSILKNSKKVSDNEEEDMSITPFVPDELDYFVASKNEVTTEEPLEPDDAEKELQLALERSRRQKKTMQGSDENAPSILERVAHNVLSKPHKSDLKGKKKNKGTIVLDSTSEFCRTLGELPTKTEEPAPMEMSDEEVEEAAKPISSGWEQVHIAEGKKPDVIKEETVELDDTVLDAEPIPTGVAATLNLATMKGYLDDPTKVKKIKFDPLNLPDTKAEIDVEKLRDEEKHRLSRGGYDRDRERYDPYAFKEKHGYKPNVKLSYVDEKGRELSQKEAFRFLSHKFHGKGSGKLKAEKRSKKLQEEMKLQTMSSIDTPLNTAAMIKAKQEKTQSPYIVLSGGGKNLLSGEALKK